MIIFTFAVIIAIDGEEALLLCKKQGLLLQFVQL
jgi:hypothetical protein